MANNTVPLFPPGGPSVAMLRNSSGGAASNTNPVAPWLNQRNNISVNVNAMNAMVQVQQQQQQDVFAQQQMANLVNSSINPMALAAQQHHQKLQMMQLRQRMEQQRGQGGDLQNVLGHSLQQQSQQHRSPPPPPNNLIQQQDQSSQQLIQYQIQQQQMKQIQMAQQHQQPPLMQQHQQQLLNQVMQQQSQNQMMQQHSQQMQALEEQKQRYALMLQKNLRAQEQSNGPVLASSHHSHQQHQAIQLPPQLFPNMDTTRQVAHRSSLGVGPQASTSPTNLPRGHSPGSNSQYATNSAQPATPSSQNSSTELSFPFYRPLSTSAKNKRQISQLDHSVSTTTDLVQHKAFEAKADAFSPPSLSKSMEGSASLPVPSQQQETKPSSAGKSVGKKTPPRRRQSQTQPVSSLKYEEVAGLINDCTTEQKIIWVARQVGASSSSGFQKSTAAMQRVKRQRARACKQKDGEGLSKDEAEEKLKLDTFDARAAKRMYAEMKQGLQYCNLMTGVVRKILEDIDPDNPILLVNPPAVGFEDASQGAELEIPLFPSTAAGNATSVSSTDIDKRPK